MLSKKPSLKNLGMSTNEFQTQLFSAMQNKGVIDEMKCMLRSQLILELNNEKATSNSKRKETSLAIQVVNSLVADYFKSYGFDYTLSVFMSETSSTFSPMKLYDILKVIGSPEMEFNSSDEPLIWQLLTSVERKRPVCLDTTVDSLNLASNHSSHNKQMAAGAQQVSQMYELSHKLLDDYQTKLESILRRDREAREDLDKQKQQMQEEIYEQRRKMQSDLESLRRRDLELMEERNKILEKQLSERLVGFKVQGESKKSEEQEPQVSSKEIENLQLQLQRLKESERRLERENESIKEQKLSLESELDSLRKETQDKIKNLTNTIEELNEANQKLESKKSLLEKEIESAIISNQHRLYFVTQEISDKLEAQKGLHRSLVEDLVRNELSPAKTKMNGLEQELTELRDRFHSERSVWLEEKGRLQATLDSERTAHQIDKQKLDMELEKNCVLKESIRMLDAQLEATKRRRDSRDFHSIVTDHQSNSDFFDTSFHFSQLPPELDLRPAPVSPIIGCNEDHHRFAFLRTARERIRNLEREADALENRFSRRRDSLPAYHFRSSEERPRMPIRVLPQKDHGDSPQLEWSYSNRGGDVSPVHSTPARPRDNFMDSYDEIGIIKKRVKFAIGDNQDSPGDLWDKTVDFELPEVLRDKTVVPEVSEGEGLKDKTVIADQPTLTEELLAETTVSEGPLSLLFQDQMGLEDSSPREKIQESSPRPLVDVEEPSPRPRVEDKTITEVFTSMYALSFEMVDDTTNYEKQDEISNKEEVEKSGDNGNGVVVSGENGSASSDEPISGGAADDFYENNGW